MKNLILGGWLGLAESPGRWTGTLSVMILRASSGLIRVAAVACLALLLWLPAAVLGGEVIPDQQGVRRFGLSNGLEVVVVPTDAMERAGGDRGRVQVWLVVRAGTMDETDEERGAASMCERVLRQGIGGLDATTIDALLSEDGSGGPGAMHQRGSIVGLDQTILTGHVSGESPDELEALLGFYSDVLDPETWDIGGDRIEVARRSLEELLSRGRTPEMLARQRWLPRLLGDGLLGTRIDMPEPEEVARLNASTISGFAERVYSPSRATLIVVGSTDRLKLDELIGASLGGLPAGAAWAVRDLKSGTENHEETVFEVEPGVEGHQVALVWVKGCDATAPGPARSWSVEAGDFDQQMMRSMLIDRVAVELIRHRVERLGVAALGGGVQVSVGRFEIGGQVDLLQCVVQNDGRSREDWQETVGYLVGECDRLACDGAGDEEIARARGSLLARWHRDADDWRSQSNRERVWLLHWLVTTGRPVIGAQRWDAMATGLMTGISDAEINAAVRSMLAPARARVLAVSAGERRDTRAMGGELASRVAEVRSEPAEPLAADWMRTLGGALLDETDFGGQVERVTQHARSGVWGAELGNGVRVWARATDGDKDKRIELSATMSGPMFGDGSLREREINASMLAWRTACSESRGARWLAVFCESKEIEVRARRVVGGVQLRVSAPSDEAESAMGLMYLLLDRPMIDPDAFAEWQASDRGKPGTEDQVERGLAMLYRPELVDDRGDASVTLDDAQRTLTRIVRNTRIEIGIAGTIDPGAEIERAGSMLGDLVARDEPRRVLSDAAAAGQGRACEIELQSDEGDEQLVVGMIGGSMAELDRLRATILASMVLSDRIREIVKERGLAGSKVDAQVAMSDALGERWAMMMWARGGDLGACESVMQEAADEILSNGIEEDQLTRVKDELDASIERYFDRAGYWSSRLSSLGVQGRTVDDLWMIRDGYAGVDVAEANEALRDVFASTTRFRVRVRDNGQR